MSFFPRLSKLANVSLKRREPCPPYLPHGEDSSLWDRGARVQRGGRRENPKAIL